MSKMDLLCIDSAKNFSYICITLGYMVAPRKPLICAYLCIKMGGFILKIATQKISEGYSENQNSVQNR